MKLSCIHGFGNKGNTFVGYRQDAKIAKEQIKAEKAKILAEQQQKLTQKNKAIVR